MNSKSCTNTAKHWAKSKRSSGNRNRGRESHEMVYMSDLVKMEGARTKKNAAFIKKSKQMPRRAARVGKKVKVAENTVREAKALAYKDHKEGETDGT